MLTSAQAPRIDSAPAKSPLLTATVPRGYVHRASVAEVLLTGWDTEASADASDAFVVRAQWPRTHALFTPAHGHQDPLLLIESIRQAGTLLAHTEYDVPFGHQFLMWDMFFDATPAAFTTSSTPTDVELHTTCHDIIRRGRSISSLRYDVTVRRDGLPVATGGARFSCTNPAVHRRLRGERPTTTGRALPAPVDPADVGHTNREHVVLAPPVSAREHRWELRVDTDHPIFFDHPIDHVPGMLLIEAARQASRAATRQPDALLVGLESSFIRYAELDVPCWIEAHVKSAETAEELRVHVRGTQEGEQVFTSDLVLRRPAR